MFKLLCTNFETGAKTQVWLLPLKCQLPSEHESSCSQLQNQSTTANMVSNLGCLLRLGLIPLLVCYMDPAVASRLHTHRHRYRARGTLANESAASLSSSNGPFVLTVSRPHVQHDSMDKVTVKPSAATDAAAQLAVTPRTRKATVMTSWQRDTPAAGVEQPTPTHSEASSTAEATANASSPDQTSTTTADTAPVPAPEQALAQPQRCKQTAIQEEKLQEHGCQLHHTVCIDQVCCATQETIGESYCMQ